MLLHLLSLLLPLPLLLLHLLRLQQQRQQQQQCETQQQYQSQCPSPELLPLLHPCCKLDLQPPVLVLLLHPPYHLLFVLVRLLLLLLQTLPLPDQLLSRLQQGQCHCCQARLFGLLLLCLTQLAEVVTPVAGPAAMVGSAEGALSVLHSLPG